MQPTVFNPLEALAEAIKVLLTSIEEGSVQTFVAGDRRGLIPGRVGWPNEQPWRPREGVTEALAEPGETEPDTQ